jgi:NAD(P)-dependent dehydrogenase (short-subunit alcohol dehydrogenase family)
MPIYLAADLSVQGQVREAARRIEQTLAAAGVAWLDGLVNNAGTFTYWMTLTPEGFEMQWAVNHLAPFLLTHELLPLLQAAPCGRIVTVSSESHRDTRLNWDDIQLRRRYNGLRAYSQTKLANVLFTLELSRRLGERSTLRAFAADPGLVNTEIGFKGTPAVVRWVWNLRRSAGVAPEVPAGWIAYLLSEPTLQRSPELYWRSGVPRTASRFALDQQSAARLWTLSARMCGLEGEA